MTEGSFEAKLDRMQPQEWQTQLEANYPLIVLLVGTLAAGVWIIRAISKRRGSVDAKPKARLIVDDAPPTCECGERATHPMPYLEWSRTGFFAWLRTLHGAPPLYERKVDKWRQPVVCETHSRIADTALDSKVHDTRTRYAALNHQIAIELAQFESEGIKAKIVESLTEAQKKKKRDAERSNVTRIVPRNGTDAELS